MSHTHAEIRRLYKFRLAPKPLVVVVVVTMRHHSSIENNDEQEGFGQDDQISIRPFRNGSPRRFPGALS